MKHSLFLLVLVFALTLSACAPAMTEPSPSVTESVADSGMPVPLTEGDATPTEMVVTELATYTDKAYGFTLDYPIGWMLDVVKLGDRAPQAIQLTSWNHEPGLITEVAEGGTSMNIVVQLWDPKGDLAAFVRQQKDAWNNSLISIVSREELTLAGGRVAQEFVVESTDGQAYTLLTVLGDQYLVFSGAGELEAIREVARSLR